MTSPTEIAANAVFALSVWLAARNSPHNWWIGVIGSVLFVWVFYGKQLYADATLQLFFIVTSLIGWWQWLHGGDGAQLPVRRTPRPWLAAAVLAALTVAGGYGWLLHRFTDAYAPFVDSAVLAISALGQLLLMNRRIETWYAWLVVDAIAVPLYLSRGLYLTAALFTAYWINAWYGLRRWRRELR